MKSVAAIVVTYNRIELLKRLLNSLRNQTENCHDIIVVNNGSTDGTKEWLETQVDLIVINQDNKGGAGGFYAGMKYAYEHGYEWLWLMDDDGVTDKNQLRNLLVGVLKFKLKFVNALVCNIDNPNILSFGLSLGGKVCMQVSDITDKPVLPAINPFNGTFINKEVVDRIGYVKKEMFIWGDETEYSYRARKAGYDLSTITNAIHYHPAIKGKLEQVFPIWKKYEVSVKPEKMSHIYYRNMGYIYKTYMPNKIYSLVVLYTILFARKLQFKELKKFYKFYFQGIKSRFV